MKVLLVYAPAARLVHEMPLELGSDATIADALAVSGWASQFPEIQSQGLQWSIWGRAAESKTPLRDGDRVELCRDLRVDPKVARRERFKGQGARGTGLFAQRRPGSKAGY